MSDLEPNAGDRPETGSRTFRKFVQRFRVTAGFALAPLLLIAARPTQLSLTVGALIAITGLAIRAWASGYLKKNQELTVSGPYAHTRNPLYFGTFILGTGVAVASGALWFTILFVVLYLLIYVPVMSAEAQTMHDLFPDDYEDYSQKVPLFLPQLNAYSKPGKQQKTETETNVFDLSLYLRYREYRAAIGCAVVFLFMIVKMMFQQ